MSWLSLSVALVYALVLFLVAWTVERRAAQGHRIASHSVTYVLALAVYLTSWSYFGGVGTAATSGWNYLPILVGPAITFLFLPRFLTRLVAVAKRAGSTSIADFISSRYGKSRAIAAVVTSLSLLAALPYIALQLRSVSTSYAELVGRGAASSSGQSLFTTMLVIAGILALFAILFGTRRYDSTGRNRGLVVAIAFESVVKISALVGVAIFAVILFLNAPEAAQAKGWERFGDLFAVANFSPDFLTITLLSMTAIICLPRQFYIGVVEAQSPSDIRRARTPFALYMAVMALVVLPTTLAGLALLPDTASPDLFVIDLPLYGGSEIVALFVFLGGFSAATAMVIVETLALSTMVSNDLLAPLLLRHRAIAREADLGRVLLITRRITIIAIIFAACGYYKAAEEIGSLASMGLIAFAAVIQFAPALVGSVYLERNEPRAALAGLAGGGILWLYTLFLPSLLTGSPVADRWYGLAADYNLHPYALLGLEGISPLTHGVLWSLGLNILLYFAFSRRSAKAEAAGEDETRLPLFQDQPNIEHTRTVGDLQRLAERFVGAEAAADAFHALCRQQQPPLEPTDPIDGATARLTERLIAGVIGAPSARIIVTSALSGASLSVGEVMRLLDQTSQSLQFSKGLLAATLENIGPGVSVVDHELRLVAWNARYLEIFDFPPGFVRVGRPIADVIRYNAMRGECGPGEVESHVEKRLAHMRRGLPHTYERVRPNGMVLKTIGGPMPGGGYVSSFTDITAEKKAQSDLQRANEMLEARVEERTRALLEANEALARAAEELIRARKSAEAATQDKTRFLAAASHDLLQPLHAARLFTAAALESVPEDSRGLVANIDRSIASADRLLRTLLDISKLDAGGIKPQSSAFAIGGLIDELAMEFGALAAEKGLSLHTYPSGFWVRTDRTLLRSVLQNFLSNAVRYTAKGGIVIGCRMRQGRVQIEVWDSGPGIPPDKHKEIFQEFLRLAPSGADEGAGLGLAIVERIARLLGAGLGVRSAVGRGSIFSVSVPRAAVPGAKPAQADTARLGPAIAGLKVLCVDNEPEILAGLEAMLTAWGCTAVTAGSYRQALDVLKRDTDIAAAFIDYQLGTEETGLDILRLIQRDAPHIRAALVTADPSAEVIAAAEALGMTVLRKPAQPNELRAVLAGQDAAKTQQRPSRARQAGGKRRA